jgi:hypothetical protein
MSASTVQCLDGTLSRYLSVLIFKMTLTTAGANLGPDLDSDNVSERHKCQKCNAMKPLSAFPIAKQGKNKGKPGGTCEPCQKKKESKARSQRDAEKENLDPAEDCQDSQGNRPSLSLDEIELEDFLRVMSLPRVDARSVYDARIPAVRTTHALGRPRRRRPLAQCSTVQYMRSQQSL